MPSRPLIMTLTSTMLSGDLVDIFADQITQTFTWRGTNYACIATDLTESNALMPEGMMISANLQLLVMASAFSGDVPKANDLIIYNSGRYRVADNGIVTSCDSLMYTINCDKEIN